LAQIFPKWTNHLPTIGAAGSALAALAVIGFFWYYGSPKYTDVGYRPKQPVAYSHKLHAGDLGIDCRYCHTNVERSPHANVPATRTCMNCHKLILPESEKLLLVRESYATEKPIEWVRVHKVADYAYFDHSAHLRAGVGCTSCHGNVAEMVEVMQVQPLSMGWCLDCHRDPGPHLRPVEEVTNMKWTPGDDHDDFVTRTIQEKNIDPPEYCAGCHR
jgi:hypothetical protein